MKGPRNLGVSLVVFAVLAIGALVRIDRSSKQARSDASFLTLGELARQLASEKQTFDLVLGKLGIAPGVLGDLQLDAMRRLFELGEYEGLDSQPQVTLDGLRSALGVLASRRGPVAFPPPPAHESEGLGLPSGKSAPTGEPYLSDLGLEMTWGDRLDPQKAKRGPDSERLAHVMNGLAMGTLVLDDGTATVEALMQGFEKSGHRVVVLDQRLAANFGDLERRKVPIATPLWVETGRVAKDGTAISIPVPHAQLVLQVRGPVVNADVTFYPALDLSGTGGGGLRFRGDVTADQPWCGGRIAHTYEKEQAALAIAWMAKLRRAYEAKLRAKMLPLDGYFALGVCTLAPAVIEHAVLGKTTLWPLTHDPALFDSEDEVDQLVRALPHDGRGAPAADDARLAASLPWATADAVPFERLRSHVLELKLFAP